MVWAQAVGATSQQSPAPLGTPSPCGSPVRVSQALSGAPGPPPEAVASSATERRRKNDLNMGFLTSSEIILHATYQL